MSGVFKNRLIGFLPNLAVAGEVDPITTAPQNVAGTTHTTTEVKWSWSPVDGATNYRVKVRNK